MSTASWDARPWEMVQSGPADAEQTVLLLARRVVHRGVLPRS